MLSKKRNLLLKWLSYILPNDRDWANTYPLIVPCPAVITNESKFWATEPILSGWSFTLTKEKLFWWLRKHFSETVNLTSMFLPFWYYSINWPWLLLFSSGSDCVWLGAEIISVWNIFAESVAKPIMGLWTFSNYPEQRAWFPLNILNCSSFCTLVILPFDLYKQDGQPDQTGEPELKLTHNDFSKVRNQAEFHCSL